MKLKAALIKILPKNMVEVLRRRKRKSEINRESNLDEKDYEKYLSEWFKKKTGKSINFKNPVTYTEKQQWLKLYDLSPLKTQLVDKYLVRRYIEEKIGSDYLIPIIAIDGQDCWTDAYEIDFKKLPNQFVIKCNHGSGYNIIIKDKSLLTSKSIEKIKKRLNRWLKENFAFAVGLELQYKDIKPLIYIEQYMAINDDLPDYKFMCFSGEVKYVWVDTGRYKNHRRTVYDLNFEKMPFHLHTYEPVLNNEQPKNFAEMIEVAQKLCGDWKYIRVDLYNVNGKIYFGELTFTSGSGIELVYPEEYNKILGNDIQINVD